MINRYPSSYTNYNAVNNEMKELPNTDALLNEKSLILKYIQDASSIMTTYCNRVFVPYIKSDMKAAYRNVSIDRSLHLPDDCLSLTSIADYTDATIDSSYYELLDGVCDVNSLPYEYVNLGYNVTIGTIRDSLGLPARFTLNGIWGYSQRPYADSWIATTTMNDPGALTASLSDTSLICTAVTGFSEYDYIRIGSEIMRITAINTSTKTLTLERAVNGSTVAIHADATAIDLWLVDEQIKLATTRLAGWIYSNRKNTTLVFGDGTVQINAAPSFVKEAIQAKRKAVNWQVV